MTFSFTQRKNVEAQVKTIAGEQIEKGLQEASQPNADIDKVVHGLRRRCKKLRGLVRLIRPEFDEADRENEAFRDAAASLSQARDAAVLVETFAGLLEFDRKGGDSRIGKSEADDIEEALTEQARSKANGADDPLAGFRTIFEAAGQRVEHWSLDSRGFDAVGEGLTANYKQFRKRLLLSQEEPIGENLHEWRKTAKYHGHHLSLLRRAAPDLLKGRQAAVDELGNLLGDHHNLAVLEETLPKFGIRGSAGDAVKAQQSVLAESAFVLGQQLAAERPEALRQRFAAYWSLLPEKA